MSLAFKFSGVCRMRAQILLFTLLSMSLSTATFAVESPSIKTTESYSRVIVPIENGATFRVLTENSNAVKLHLERTRLEHLADFSALLDKRVAKVDARRAGLDSADIVVGFQGQNVDSFAYLQPSPPAVVIDIWEKKADAKTKVPAVVVAKPAKKNQPKQRLIASVKPKAKESLPPLDAKKDIFPRFPVPMPVLSFSEGRLALPPRLDIEKMWSFSKPESKPGEASEAFNFAQKLFEAGKYGLCIRSLEIAFRDHPNNPYESQMRLLMAFAYKRLGETSKTPVLQAKADEMLKGLGAKTDEAGHFLPFHQTIRIYFANKAYLAGQWFDAIDQYEALGVGIDASMKEFPYLQMILAELYGRVEQPRRAERIYRYMQEHLAKHPMTKEAAYRKVSLLALEKNYPRVVEEAANALHSYREYESTRPEVLFELGEANFWRHDFGAAKKAFTHFLQIAPAHTLAAEAHVRLGEVAEVDDHDLATAKEEYLAAKNGFPFSNGDHVASLRLARLALPSEEDIEFQIHTLEEIKNSQQSDPQMKQIADLLLVEYMSKQGELAQAIDIARAGMVANAEGIPNTLFKEAYIDSLFKQMQTLNKAKDYAGTLKLYDGEKQWLDQYGPEVFRELAEAYKGVGLYATSNKYIQRFLAERSKSRHLASEGGSDRSLRIERAKNALAQSRFGEALAELGKDEADATALHIQAAAHFGLRQWGDAERASEKGLEMLSDQESPAKEITENFGNILIARGERERDYGKMLMDIEKVRKLLPEKEDRFEFARADALWYLRRHKEASTAYSEAIAAFPKSNRVERAKYNLGMSYIAMGKSDDAVKTLTDLRDKSQTLWGQSAKQELELMDWEKKYSSVLKSLPPSGLGITN